MRSVPRGGENEALARLSRLLPRAPAGQVWAGDDAAVVTVPGAAKRLLIALDTVVGGLDADLSLTTLADFGWKAMAVNLSDIAAMGGMPGYAVVSVVGLGPDELEQLYSGIVEASSQYSCPVVGGDLSGGDQLVVSVALTGWVDGSPVLRSGARPGDRIWVTGPLGAAAAGLRVLRSAVLSAGGLGGQGAEAGGASGSGSGGDVQSALVRAHARPRPALAEGAAARCAGATAMIDVSDGLATDLGHIAEHSGVGFELDDVPVAPGAVLQEALAGGDDYVLVFTLAPELDAGPSFAAAGLGPPHLIGSCTADPFDRLLGGRPLTAAGWEHAL